MNFELFIPANRALMSFRDTFERFRQEFTKERALVVSLSSINNKASLDLRSEYSDLLNVSSLLCRLHYMAHSERTFSLDDALFPLRGIQPLPLATALRVFQKPNHKDRYAMLIAHLRDNPDVFAQLAYFALLAPANRRANLKGCDAHRFTDDDSIFFCFHSVPAMYNFFLTRDDQLAAVAFIDGIFRFHIAVHGPNFERPHRFLSDLVFSFFAATNPGTFFESAVLRLRKFIFESPDVRLQYNSDLSRRDYWHKCIPAP
jgi:hypothetical protein